MWIDGRVGLGWRFIIGGLEVGNGREVAKERAMMDGMSRC